MNNQGPVGNASGGGALQAASARTTQDPPQLEQIANKICQLNDRLSLMVERLSTKNDNLFGQTPTTLADGNKEFSPPGAIEKIKLLLNGSEGFVEAIQHQLDRLDDAI